jgi:hypothetical protein
VRLVSDYPEGSLLGSLSVNVIRRALRWVLARHSPLLATARLVEQAGIYPPLEGEQRSGGYTPLWEGNKALLVLGIKCLERFSLCFWSWRIFLTF